jgi:hypothetical protein
MVRSGYLGAYFEVFQDFLEKGNMLLYITFDVFGKFTLKTLS